MKRLCIQFPGFGPYHVARVAQTHAYFRERGVEVIGLETAGDVSVYIWDNEGTETPFRRVTLFPERSFESLRPEAIWKAMHAALDELQPDAVATHSYFLPDARAALDWCRTHGRTAVTMTDSKADDAPRVWWREWLKSVIVQQFDGALCAGTPQQAYLEQLGLPSHTIFHGYHVVDNAYFTRGAEQTRRDPEAYRHLPGLDDPTPFFVTSGRFIPRKNLARLLTAYARYRTLTDAPWRLILVGDGRLRPEVEAQIAREGIQGVVITGKLGLDDLPPYYGLAGALVHPPLQDQWALVVNEAMAARLPVLVSTGAGSSIDLVDEGVNGYRVDPYDVEGMARRMATLSNESTDRAAMGRRSFEIVQDWDLDRFATGLWKAVQAGRPRTGRPYTPLARVVMTAMRLAAREVRSFAALEA